MHKKILCVGFNNNGLSLLLEILIRLKNFEGKRRMTLSAGIDNYARNCLPVPNSILKISEELGFYITRQKPLHHNVAKDCEKRGLAVLYRVPKHINEIKFPEVFHLIVTPYLYVYKQLQGRHNIERGKLVLACPPEGIPPNIKDFEDAPAKMRNWTNDYF